MSKVLIGTIFNIGSLKYWVDWAKSVYRLDNKCELEVNIISNEYVPQLFYNENASGDKWLSLE